MGISITEKDLKEIIRQEIERYWEQKELEEDKVIKRALQSTTEEEQEEEASPQQIRKYCKRRGYMNTADFFKTVNNLAKSQKGILFKKSD